MCVNFKLCTFLNKTEKENTKTLTSFITAFHILYPQVQGCYVGLFLCKFSLYRVVIYGKLEVAKGKFKNGQK